jgi:hypothetical protein
MAHYVEALALYKEFFGISHQWVGSVLCGLASAHYCLGQPEKAIEHGQQSLKIIREAYDQEKEKMEKKLFGDKPNPLPLANLLNNLGVFCCAARRWEDAAEYLQETVAIKTQFYGNKTHPEVTAALNDLTKANEALERKAQSLIMLDLAPNKEITDNELITLIKENSNLTSLDLSYCENISDRGLVGAFKDQCYPRVTKINLSGWDHSSAITDTGLKAIAQSCPELIEVNLSGRGITNSGLNKLVRSCHKLNQVILNCPKIKISHLQALQKMVRREINLFNLAD